MPTLNIYIFIFFLSNNSMLCLSKVFDIGNILIVIVFHPNKHLNSKIPYDKISY
ncbi:MAG: hypothetical protein K0S41_934 [Anaerocolumna sp.]|jgi:hypothetical protein|nr:hypothetical protein [Anaerocolumna sp.]